MLFIDGYASDEFCAVLRAHHCLIDGTSGANALKLLFAEAGLSEDEHDRQWSPRARPSDTVLVLDAIERRLAQPLRTARRIADGLLNRTDEHRGREMANRIRQRASNDSIVSTITTVQDRTVAELPGAMMSVPLEIADRALSSVAPLLKQAPASRINVTIGPDRSFISVPTPLADYKIVSHRFSVTVNDVILAVASGALQRILADDSEDVPQLLAMVPVNMRTPRGRFHRRFRGK
jgi:hypothetical protein